MPCVSVNEILEAAVPHSDCALVSVYVTFISQLQKAIICMHGKKGKANQTRLSS